MKQGVIVGWITVAMFVAVSCSDDDDTEKNRNTTNSDDAGLDRDGGRDAESDEDGSQPTSDTDIQLCCNGVTDSVEDCDDGCNKDNLDGCTDICTFTCQSDADCDDGELCNGSETCDTLSHTCKPGATLSNGESCGAGLACMEGICRDTHCDDSQDCYSECNPSATCDEETRTCTPGDPVSNGTLCENGGDYCKGGLCVEADCGDGIQEPSEECDLGDQNGRDGSQCTDNCSRFECGNAIIEGDEQCDDGNNHNLDGCDIDCRAEFVYRINELNIITDPAPDFCTYAQNETEGNSAASLFSGMLGERLGLLNILNAIINQSFESGEDNLFFHLIGVADSAFRTSDSLITIGVTSGFPAEDWSSRSTDLDFPMRVDSAETTPDGFPLETLSAALSVDNNTVVLRTTLPGSFNLSAGFFILHIRQAQITIPADPRTSTPKQPPFVAESVVALESFGLTTSDGPGGIMCGAMPVSAFDAIAFIPEFALLCPEYVVCENGQDPTQDECDSFADLMAGGCGAFLNSVEPDVDLDGDGINDAYSLVAAYSQIRVKLSGIE